MKTSRRRFLLVSALAGCSLFLAACGGGGGGGSSSGGSGSNTVTAQNAPDAIPSGVTMSMNPTLTFSAGSLNYTNDNPAGEFTASMSNGLYAYVPYSSGDGHGTITVTGDGATDGKRFSGAGTRTVMEVDFVGTPTQITGGTLSIGGATYAVTFGGTPMSPGKGRNGGGTVVAQSVIPVSLNGPWPLYFGGGQNVSGSPSKDGDKVVFNIVGDSVTVNGVTMTPTKVNDAAFTCTNGAITYFIQAQGSGYPNYTYSLNYVAAYVNGVYAGKYTRTQQQTVANNPVASVVGKTFTAVVTYSDNQTGSANVPLQYQMITGSLGVNPSPGSLQLAGGGTVQLIALDYGQPIGVYAEPGVANKYTSGIFSKVSAVGTGSGLVTATVDPATNMLIEVREVVTYPSGKVDTHILKIVGI